MNKEKMQEMKIELERLQESIFSLLKDAKELSKELTKKKEDIIEEVNHLHELTKMAEKMSEDKDMTMKSLEFIKDCLSTLDELKIFLVE